MAELLSQLTSSELTEWSGMRILHPFGTEVDDYRAGVAAAATYNVHRNAEETPPVLPLDFFNRVEPEELTPEEEADAVRALLNQKGGAKEPS